MINQRATISVKGRAYSERYEASRYNMRSPNTVELWLADGTYVRVHSGMYALIITEHSESAPSPPHSTSV